MLGSRAARLVDPAENKTTRTKPTKTLVRKLTEDQTDARWKSITLKILQVIRLIAHKHQVITLLTKPVYLRIFGEFRQQEQTFRQNQDFIIHRVIDGEIMGMELPQASASSKINENKLSPLECQHPPTQVVRGGNKNA